MSSAVRLVVPLKSRCSRKCVEPYVAGCAASACCSSREPTATQKPTVTLRLPGTCSLRTRTPDGSTLRRTRASPAAVKESSAWPSGRSTAPFIPPSLCHGGRERARQSTGAARRAFRRRRGRARRAPSDAARTDAAAISASTWSGRVALATGAATVGFARSHASAIVAGCTPCANAISSSAESTRWPRRPRCRASRSPRASRRTSERRRTWPPRNPFASAKYGSTASPCACADELARTLERPALHEVVPGREQLEPRQSVRREHARLDEPLGREVGGADRADLAGGDERVDRAEALLERNVGVVAVEEQHVDAVGAESQQRVVDRGADVDRREAAVVGVAPDLRHDAHAVARAPGAHPRADDRLAAPGRVAVGGVEQVAARSGEPVEHREGVVGARGSSRTCCRRARADAPRCRSRRASSAREP